MSNAFASVLLPAAGYAEKDGTTTNLEGRVSGVRAKVSAPGLARADWMIASEIAFALGTDLEVESAADITELIAKHLPEFAGITPAALAAQPDGVLVPVEVATPWSVKAEAPIPTPDAYSLRLITSRELYDQGTSVQHSPSMAGLARAAAAHLHPGEVERHGLRSGDEVRVTSQTNSVVMHVAEDKNVPRGSVWIPFNQTGSGAADLIDTDDLFASGGITKVRLESVSG
jgi:predicted molibdopterin-dependent oxidoreductase YjgC